MRTRLSWVLTVLGALCAIAGLAVMLILGPDSRFTTGPHAVDTDGIAVVTAPKVISWADVQVDVLAEVPAEKPVFVGLGNTVDVQNYVGKTTRLEVTGFHTPWKVKTRQVEGRPGLPGAPTALDWWLADSAGRGGASISTNLPDETVSFAILSVGDTNLSGLKVSSRTASRADSSRVSACCCWALAAVLLGRLMRRGDDSCGATMRGRRRKKWSTSTSTRTASSTRSPPTRRRSTRSSTRRCSRTAQTPSRSLRPTSCPARWPLKTNDEDEEEVVYIYVDEDGVEHEISAEEAEELRVPRRDVVDEPEPEPSRSQNQSRSPSRSQPPRRPLRRSA